MRYITLLLLLTFLNIGYSQIVENEYIIEVNDRELNSFIAELDDDISRSIMHYRIISKDLNLVMVYSSEKKALTEFLDSNDKVSTFYPNTYTQLRNIPDDPQFTTQWNIKKIETTQLWEITTGGKNFYGDDIVVAILDKGFFNDHEDIEENIWTNPGEIQSDGIDNDNNGYIDDYYGLNVQTGTDLHTSHHHGLGVAGIVGAKGDNGIGISGINWDVKILTISETLTTDRLIEGYQYVYELRKKYNSTQGAEGAYIVATNYSAGVQNQFGTAPGNKAWCKMYDLLGSVGIISCGATANSDINVDEVGDLPSTCPSDYFIAVTNTTRDDELNELAGYGRVNIDLAAPGSGGISLLENDNYGSFGGTSGATPHVAGAIALLHSLDCEEITRMSIEEPQEHALKMKDAILSQVDKIPALENITLSGGRLNVLNAARIYGSVCDNIMIPSSRGGLVIKDIRRIGKNYVNIEYLSPDEDNDYRYIMMDKNGQVLRSGEFIPPVYGVKQITIAIPENLSGIYYFTIYNVGQISTKSMLLIKNQ